MSCTPNTWTPLHSYKGPSLAPEIRLGVYDRMPVGEGWECFYKVNPMVDVHTWQDCKSFLFRFTKPGGKELVITVTLNNMISRSFFFKKTVHETLKRLRNL